MSHLLWQFTLFAQNSRLDSMGSRFRGRSLTTHDILVGATIIGGIAGAIWLLSYLMTIRERRWVRNSPMLLFVSLSWAHKLSLGDAWLLWRVVKSQRLADPGRVFLEPERLAPANLKRSLQSQAGRLKRIAKKLYGDLADKKRDDSDKKREPAPSLSAGAPVESSGWSTMPGMSSVDQ